MGRNAVRLPTPPVSLKGFRGLGFRGLGFRGLGVKEPGENQNVPETLGKAGHLLSD